MSLKTKLDELSIKDIHQKMKMIEKMGTWVHIEKEHEGIKKSVEGLEK